VACSTIAEHSQQEGFTECRCQRHVQPPTWRTRDLEHSNFRHKRPPASEATLENLAAEGGTMGEKWPRNFAESGDLHVTFGFFYMPWSTTWDRRLYFPSEGRRAEDFFAPKNPTASAGFGSANSGTKGQHATSRPPKPLPVRTVQENSMPGYILYPASKQRVNVEGSQRHLQMQQ
jgi:hypothetical protein